MKIVVLAGGISTERDVSLCSGRNIYEALKGNGHDVVLVDLFLGLPEEKEPLDHLFTDDRDWSASVGTIAEDAPDIAHVKALRPNYRSLLGPNVLKLCELSDMVFLALHGENGEDGKIQALFDLMGIRYTGTGYTSSALCMDKNITKQMFRGRNVPTPPGITVQKGKPFRLPESVGYPCMVKTCCGGSSVGVYRVNDASELEKALDEAFTFEDQAIIERCIIGREFSIAVIEGEALPIIEIAPISGFYDYKNKYQPGSTIETCPADLPKDLTQKMQHYAEMVFQALGMRSYARMDFMLDTDTLDMYCLEANTLPGMTPTSLLPQEAAALGMSFEDLCEKLIEVSLKKEV